MQCSSLIFISLSLCVDRAQNTQSDCGWGIELIWHHADPGPSPHMCSSTWDALLHPLPPKPPSNLSLQREGLLTLLQTWKSPSDPHILAWSHHRSILFGKVITDFYWISMICTSTWQPHHSWLVWAQNRHVDKQRMNKPVSLSMVSIICKSI